MVVKASDQRATYFLRSVLAPVSDKDEMVAHIVVDGAPVSTALPLGMMQLVKVLK